MCILGADQLDTGDRLRFLDTVASLLPYGMRSHLSASTWTSSTFQGHKFRLFFASAPRSADDHLIVWDQTNDAPIGHLYADDYLDWLREDAQQRAVQLSTATEPMGFAGPEVLRMLARIRIGSATDNPPKPVDSANIYAAGMAKGMAGLLQNTPRSVLQDQKPLGGATSPERPYSDRTLPLLVLFRPLRILNFVILVSSFMWFVGLLPWYVPLIIVALGITTTVAWYLMLDPSQRRRLRAARRSRQIH